MSKPKAWLLAGVFLLSTAAACSGASKGLPGSLYGSWRGGNDAVKSVRFSNGGRVELNEGKCAGEYQLSAIDGNKGTVRSGYIQCGGIMDGYFMATVTVEGNSMSVSGSVINGTYQRS